MDKMEVLQTTTQTHVHEFKGDTEYAEEGNKRHNHQFTGVTSQVIPMGDSHIHGLFIKIEFLNHHHQVIATTGFPIYVWGKDKTHVHFVKSITTMDEGHFHKIWINSLFPSPLV